MSARRKRVNAAMREVQPTSARRRKGEIARAFAGMFKTMTQAFMNVPAERSDSLPWAYPHRDR